MARRVGTLSKNVNAFLDMIGYSEGTVQIPGGDDGYLVIVGSTVGHPILMDGYTRHPDRLIHLGAHLESTAAGRYQMIFRTWEWMRARLRLPDFSPESQDRAAIRLIEDAGALSNIEGGEITAAIVKCRKIWASFPGAGYGQRENSLYGLTEYYRAMGGSLA